jgi:hypothetical protein
MGSATSAARRPRLPAGKQATTDLAVCQVILQFVSAPGPAAHSPGTMFRMAPRWRRAAESPGRSANAGGGAGLFFPNALA